MPPRFSVIVPAYRAPRTIPTTIESVLGQSLGDFELIVVDDGSGDETPEIVAGYVERDPRIVLIRQANAGTPAARNTGIGHARGRYLSFLDNDDAWMPDYLREIDAELGRWPDAGLAYADAWTLNDHSRRVHRQTALECYPPVPPAEDPARFSIALLKLNFITASSVTVTRTAIEEVGNFRTDVKGSDDWDLWLRVVSAGYRAVRAGTRPLVVLRESSTSQSKDDLLMAQSSLRVIEHAIEREPEDTAPGRLAREVARRRRRDLEEAAASTPLGRFSAAAKRRLRPLKQAALRRWEWRPAPAELRTAFPDVDEI